MGKLRAQKWLLLASDFSIELDQCRTSGKDISPYQDKVKKLQAMDPASPEAEALARELAAAFEALPADTDADEPDAWEDIKPLLQGNGPSDGRLPIPREDLADRLYGAWLGRSAGCLLGKPVEGWRRAKIMDYLKETGNYPITGYFSANLPEDRLAAYGIGGNRSCYREHITHMPEDDDTNYTVLGLEILKRNGYEFTPEDVGVQWLASVPLLSTCTAERVAYVNLCNTVAPPESARRNNPYREYIGAQIRADFFGYAAPGDPALAAEMAWRDASVTHVKNGLYGEMFVAAMLAEAYRLDDIPALVRAGMDYIPPRSRLHERLELVLSWYESGLPVEEAFRKLHALYDEASGFDWCHVISNAMIVAIALLYGEKDFEKTIGYAVEVGFDTDCNGATAGSILGLMLGARALPAKWTEPLQDTLESGIKGYSSCKLRDLAEQSVAVILSRYR